jgi:hypothetical protein
MMRFRTVRTNEAATLAASLLPAQDTADPPKAVVTAAAKRPRGGAGL